MQNEFSKPITLREGFKKKKKMEFSNFLGDPPPPSEKLEKRAGAELGQAQLKQYMQTGGVVYESPISEYNTSK